MALERPAVGAVALVQTPYGHHVGLVTGRTREGHLVLLGGNQVDSVRHVAFRTSDVVAFRYPPGVPLPTSFELPEVDVRTLNREESRSRVEPAVQRPARQRTASVAPGSPARFVYEGPAGRQELVLTRSDAREAVFEVQREGACACRAAAATAGSTAPCSCAASPRLRAAPARADGRPSRARPARALSRPPELAWLDPPHAGVAVSHGEGGNFQPGRAATRPG